ncbi:LysR family transcriptional regulator [Aminobacter sp. DSM 101952]|uniref:LysR family transcriptional regulator n=1 Tax=Aminobacter sp. DSM 101952 TaxID=2735891 RepID=UPI0009EC24F6|nr:LysR family transcriptional regulator [Aminobacter sp. DSM 101952]
MDWEHLQHFAALANSGSLSGAARLLGVEHATVARRVAALEKSLGLKLVDRRGRRITLTSEGHRIFNIVARMEVGALEIQRVAGGVQSEPKGQVTISVPPAFAAAVLMPHLVALQQRHSGLKLNIIGEIRNASLERREADIALRLSRPEQGDLTIVRLGQIEFEPYASATYLQETAESDWCFIGYGHLIDQAVQQHALESLAAGRRFTLLASTIELQLAAVRAGAGIAMLPSFLTGNEGGIIRIYPDINPVLRDVWLVVHTDLKDAAPIRAVIDALRSAFPSSRPLIDGTESEI